MFELLRQFNHEQGRAELFINNTAALAQRCDRTIDMTDGQVA
jgi:predicted ABC-type transport system involved in lysophospholipase L1 biosynthesis ATPase subunit